MRRLTAFGTLSGATNSTARTSTRALGLTISATAARIRFQAEIPDQVAPIQKLYDDWNLAFIGIEAVASNVGLLQLAQRTRMTVKRLNPMGQDKLIRATQALVLAESGRIWFPEPGVRPGMPLAAIETELLLFTGVEGAEVVGLDEEQSDRGHEGQRDQLEHRRDVLRDGEVADAGEVDDGGDPEASEGDEN